MTAVIYDPLEEFETKFQNLHSENTEKFFLDNFYNILKAFELLFIFLTFFFSW